MALFYETDPGESQSSHSLVFAAQIVILAGERKKRTTNSPTRKPTDRPTLQTHTSALSATKSCR